MTTRRLLRLVTVAASLIAFAIALIGGADADEAQSAEIVRDSWVGGHGPELVRLPPGQVLLGSWQGDAEREEDEFPRIRVTFGAPLDVGRTEVTVADYAGFVEDTGYQTDAVTTGCALWEDGRLKLSREASWQNLPGFATGPDYPAVCVSWRDAVAYTDWLSEKTGRRYRLPSEAEWEYAARADTASRRFWGDQPDQACAFANVADRRHRARYPFAERQVHDCDDGYEQAAPVAARQPNGFGLYDMLGNVWEWTCSVYEASYRYSRLDCADRSEPGARVLRGGAWYLPPRSVRSAHRNAGAATAQAVSIGFRVVRDGAVSRN